MTKKRMANSAHSTPQSVDSKQAALTSALASIVAYIRKCKAEGKKP